MEPAMRADTDRLHDGILHIRAPKVLLDALDLAAAERLATASEYARRMLINGLKAEGVEPSPRAVRT
jgi:hypothetical protein